MLTALAHVAHGSCLNGDEIFCDERLYYDGEGRDMDVANSLDKGRVDQGHAGLVVPRGQVEFSQHGICTHGVCTGAQLSGREVLGGVWLEEASKGYNVHVGGRVAGSADHNAAAVGYLSGIKPETNRAPRVAELPNRQQQDKA